MAENWDSFGQGVDMASRANQQLSNTLLRIDEMSRQRDENARMMEVRGAENALTQQYHVAEDFNTVSKWKPEDWGKWMESVHELEIKAYGKPITQNPPDTLGAEWNKDFYTYGKDLATQQIDMGTFIVGLASKHGPGAIVDRIGGADAAQKIAAAAANGGVPIPALWNGAQSKTLLPEEDEVRFQSWYKKYAGAQEGLSANPDDPHNYYDWRGYYKDYRPVIGGKPLVIKSAALDGTPPDPAMKGQVLIEPDTDGNEIVGYIPEMDKYKLPGHPLPPDGSNQPMSPIQMLAGLARQIDVNGKGGTSMDKIHDQMLATMRTKHIDDPWLMGQLAQYEIDSGKLAYEDKDKRIADLKKIIMKPSPEEQAVIDDRHASTLERQRVDLRREVQSAFERSANPQEGAQRTEGQRKAIFHIEAALGYHSDLPDDEIPADFGITGQQTLKQAQNHEVEVQQLILAQARGEIAEKDLQIRLARLGISQAQFELSRAKAVYSWSHPKGAGSSTDNPLELSATEKAAFAGYFPAEAAIYDPNGVRAAWAAGKASGGVRIITMGPAKGKVIVSPDQQAIFRNYGKPVEEHIPVPPPNPVATKGHTLGSKAKGLTIPQGVAPSVHNTVLKTLKEIAPSYSPGDGPIVVNKVAAKLAAACGGSAEQWKPTARYYTTHGFWKYVPKERLKQQKKGGR